jgi:hypothetical protein
MKPPAQAVLGDGAAWMWNSAEELFLQAIQILDRFHAKEHISDIGKLLFPDGIERKNWIQRRYDELDQGRLAALVPSAARQREQMQRGAGLYSPYLEQSEPNAIPKVSPTCLGIIKFHPYWLLTSVFREATAKPRKNGMILIRAKTDSGWGLKCSQNARRMTLYYPPTLRGLCTSGGVVEAGCKVVVGTRLKRAGMHWTVRGANAIIALRCSKLSGRFEDFWEPREIQAKAAA